MKLVATNHYFMKLVLPLLHLPTCPQPRLLALNNLLVSGMSMLSALESSTSLRKKAQQGTERYRGKVRRWYVSVCLCACVLHFFANGTVFYSVWAMVRAALVHADITQLLTVTYLLPPTALQFCCRCGAVLHGTKPQTQIAVIRCLAHGTQALPRTSL